MKIVADQAIPFIQHFFSPLGELQLIDGAQIDAAAVADADALLVRTVTRIDEHLLRESQLAFVGSATSGIDHVDTDYLAKRGIRFAHAPGCNARAVAEYVLSSLFVMADRQGFELADKQLGIIGYGHVGRQLESLLQSCGMRSRVNDPLLQEKIGDHRFCELDEVLRSDVVSLHVPLSKAGRYPTYHLINADSLKRVKRDVILINTSRGGVVDEAALLAFKKQNLDAHIVLDVWDNEPDINTELLALTSINTPHIAGYSADARLAGTGMLCAAFEQAAVLKPPLLPESALGEISLDGFGSDMEAIQMAVLSAYDVRGDSGSLQQILGLDEQQRAAFFHDLRKHYPVRREFPAMRVRVKNARPGLEQKLIALGFKVIA